MIFLRITSPNEAVVIEITKMLLSEKLVMDVNMKRNVERLTLKDGHLHSSKVTLITAKTKSALFDTIDERIRAAHDVGKIEIYSLPIVHMDWEEAKKLGAEVAG